MNKKDRIAVVCSTVYSLLPIAFITEGIVQDGSKDLFQGFLILIPLVVYWGYRFIKNDISFIKSSKEE